MMFAKRVEAPQQKPIQKPIGKKPVVPQAHKESKQPRIQENRQQQPPKQHQEQQPRREERSRQQPVVLETAQATVYHSDANDTRLTRKAQPQRAPRQSRTANTNNDRTANKQRQRTSADREASFIDLVEKQ